MKDVKKSIAGWSRLLGGMFTREMDPPKVKPIPPPEPLPVPPFGKEAENDDS